MVPTCQRAVPIRAASSTMLRSACSRSRCWADLGMMQLVAPLDRSMHRPFRIGDGDSESGPRLGGRAPALEYALPLASGSQYVLTFPLIEQPVVFASVFVNGGVDVLRESMNDGVQFDDRLHSGCSPWRCFP